MTLRKLSDRLGVASPDGDSQNIALVFVLDAGFITALHALLYSMAVNRTLLDLPIIVISDVSDVLSDTVIDLVADHKRLISDDDIALFKDVSAKKPRLRPNYSPKYTFLKFMIFDDYGYDKLIFLDADIVCMQPFDELANLDGADLFGAPLFGNKLLQPTQEQRSVSEKIVRFTMAKLPSSRRLNSGVLVIGRKLLTADFRNELIAFSEKGSYANDQGALRDYLYSTGFGDVRMISPVYNFKANMIDFVDGPHKYQLLAAIKLFHYAGLPRRPWEKAAPETFIDHVWFGYALEAARSDIFSALRDTMRLPT